MKIGRKVFLLMLACVGVSFFIAGIIVFYSKSATYSEISKTNQQFLNFTADETWTVLKNQIKADVAALTVARAIQVEDEIQEMQSDTLKLSKKMSHVVSNLSHYSAREIFDPRGSNVPEKIPFIFYSEEIANNVNFGLADEISRVANIKDDLQYTCESYEPYKNSCYIASEKGYFICIDYYSPGYPHAEEFADNNFTFDARQRNWYEKAKQSQQLTFSDVYQDTDNKWSITCAAPYYDRGTFAGVVGIGMDISAWYQKILDSIKSENRICFILKQDGTLIFSSINESELSFTDDKHNLLTSPNEKIAETAKKMVDGQSGVESISLYHKDYYLSYAPLKTLGWSLGILTAKHDILKDAAQTRENFLTRINDFNNQIEETFHKVNLMAIIAFLSMLLLLLFVSEKLAEKMTKPLNAMIDTVKEISEGNLDKKIDYKSGDEIESLTDAINVMTEKLKTQMNNLEKVTADKERIATELKVATNIQLSMLPHDFNFGRTDFEIFATMYAAKEVGGDFYDFYLLDENHLVITIADVSGKGVPAALFMANSKTILKNFSMNMQSADDFAAVMTLTNNQLCQNNDEMMFVTVFMGMLEINTGKFIFVNGGHNPPMIYNSAEKTFKYLKVEENCVLGLMDGLDFVQQETTLNHGEILYLYTDGVTEAMDEQKNQYGEQKLADCLNAVDVTISLETILQKVRDDLTKHVGAAEQSDDITMLALRRN